ncbi:hypothetical protein Tco_0033070 [Tanacetum coccineum]
MTWGRRRSFPGDDLETLKVPENNIEFFTVQEKLHPLTVANNPLSVVPGLLRHAYIVDHSCDPLHDFANTTFPFYTLAQPRLISLSISVTVDQRWLVDVVGGLRIRVFVCLLGR